MLLPGEEGSPSPQLGSPEGPESSCPRGAHQGCRKDELSEHLAGLDRLCCPQPADSKLALWLAIRSPLWGHGFGGGGGNHSSRGQVSLPSLWMLLRSLWYPIVLPLVAEPHGRCAACGLSKPAGTCTGLSHTGLCRSRGCSTCSRGEGSRVALRGREGPSLPLFPLGNLHLGSHRWVTLMGLGAE